MARASEDRFLGSLLGLAIGDALGMPVEGWSSSTIAERYGSIDGYHIRVFTDGAEFKAGEFTDESELALCVVESLTANQGILDPENIAARFSFLARGESKRWMGAATLAAIAAIDASDQHQVPLDEDGPATGDVAARAAPIGLFNALGRFNADRFRDDVERVTRITHGSPAAIAAATAVAYGVNLAARDEIPRQRWAEATAEFLAGGSLAERLAEVTSLLEARTPVADALGRLGTGSEAVESVASGFYAAMVAERFEDAVFAAVNAGGDADTVGAIAGTLAGASHGVAGIPQRLIDELEGRIYISLAAPWFFRTAQRRAGLAIDIRSVEG